MLYNITCQLNAVYYNIIMVRAQSISSTSNW